jgi:hypothetical protein
MPTTSSHKDFTLTQRPLTAAELADARTAYNAIGKLYYALGFSAGDLVQASNMLANLVQNRTTDGKPLRTERVPTAADIGRRVRCKDHESYEWTDDLLRLVGFMSDGGFATENENGTLMAWSYAIIDEEGAQ